MEIDINQKAISIGDKYSICINSAQVYFASKKLFTLLSDISLFKSNEALPYLTINKDLSIVKAEYTITLNDTVYKFKTVSLWKLQYQFIIDDDTFDIYGNKGRRYSIYKNNIQIAYWEKKLVSWFDGDNYRMYLDSTANKEILIAFCLIIDDYASNDNGNSTINFDLGNFGWGLKKFNDDWKPN